MRTRLLRDFKNFPNQELVSDCIFLLDAQAKLRQIGMEQQHKEGKYY